MVKFFFRGRLNGQSLVKLEGFKDHVSRGMLGQMVASLCIKIVASKFVVVWVRRCCGKGIVYILGDQFGRASERFLSPKLNEFWETLLLLHYNSCMVDYCGICMGAFQFKFLFLICFQCWAYFCHHKNSKWGNISKWYLSTWYWR